MKKGDLVITCPGEEWAAAAKTRALTEEQRALFKHVGFSQYMSHLFGKRGVVTALILTGDEEDKRIQVTHFEPDDDVVHSYIWPPELVKVVKEYHPDDEDNPY